jgi:hypothetical protein
MRIARAFAIKTVLPLCVAGSLFSGLAVVGSTVNATVNAASAAPSVHLAMAAGGAHSKMLYD